MSNLESYAHKAAKAVVCEWLRTDKENCGPLRWSSNRSYPYGVWEEYPMLNNDRGIHSSHCVWDEELYPDNWPNNNIVGDWVHERPPTLKELRALGYSVKGSLIADIAIQHKGSIIYAIEITHKHGLSRAKKDMYIDAGIGFIELDATWVLSQIGIPDKWICLTGYGSFFNLDKLKQQKGRIR